VRFKKYTSKYNDVLFKYAKHKVKSDSIIGFEH